MRSTTTSALSPSHVDTHRAVWHASPVALNVNDALRFAYILTEVEVDQSVNTALVKQQRNLGSRYPTRSRPRPPSSE